MSFTIMPTSTSSIPAWSRVAMPMRRPSGGMGVVGLAEVGADDALLGVDGAYHIGQLGGVHPVAEGHHHLDAVLDVGALLCQGPHVLHRHACGEGHGRAVGDDDPADAQVPGLVHQHHALLGGKVARRQDHVVLADDVENRVHLRDHLAPFVEDEDAAIQTLVLPVGSG